ncbi:MAG: hypothetical protein HYV09_40450, partial [Deltaproteobacteria bacterium]|nr:hypothetical protein [Deltaproteobacteria bacterium]
TFIPPDTFSPPDTFIPPDTWTFDTAVGDTAVFDTGFDTGFDAPPEGGILCGGSYCNAATQQCCASFTGVTCVAKGSCSGGTTLSCSSAASCPIPGQVCCFSGIFGGGTPTATCQLFCAGFRLCASSAECPSGQSCLPTIGGYRICR